MGGGLLDRHDVVDGDLLLGVDIECAPREEFARLRPGVGAHLLVVADDAVDLRHGGKGFGLGLRRAAGDEHPRVWPLALEPADRLARLAYRLSRDRAGVDHDGIAEPRALGVAADHFRLVGVEPAPEGDHVHAVMRGHSRLQNGVASLAYDPRIWIPKGRLSSDAHAAPALSNSAGSNRPSNS